jgi:SAM-dependent methyltransferase
MRVREGRAAHQVVRDDAQTDPAVHAVFTMVTTAVESTPGRSSESTRGRNGSTTPPRWPTHAALPIAACSFNSGPAQVADIIVSLDSFEHFDEPAEILATMNRILKPTGSVLVAFGPTW